MLFVAFNNFNLLRREAVEFIDELVNLFFVVILLRSRPETK